MLFLKKPKNFLKLQRVFSVDASSYIPYVNPTFANKSVTEAYSVTVPNNVIWIIKNLTFSTGKFAPNPNSYSVIYTDPLIITVNNSVIETGIHNNVTITTNISRTAPLILSPGFVLKFFVYSNATYYNPEYYPFCIFYTVEEYVVE